jgi:hypothetical protein
MDGAGVTANRQSLREGEPVKWRAFDSNRVFSGRIVSRIDDKYHLVRDGTGLPPRIVRTDRLERDYTPLFEPKDAA